MFVIFIVPLSEIQGIIVGAFSSTFDKKKEYVKNFTKFQLTTKKTKNIHVRKSHDKSKVKLIGD